MYLTDVSTIGSNQEILNRKKNQNQKILKWALQNPIQELFSFFVTIYSTGVISIWLPIKQVATYSQVFSEDFKKFPSILLKLRNNFFRKT